MRVGPALLRGAGYGRSSYVLLPAGRVRALPSRLILAADSSRCSVWEAGIEPAFYRARAPRDTSIPTDPPTRRTTAVPTSKYGSEPWLSDFVCSRPSCGACLSKLSTRLSSVLAVKRPGFCTKRDPILNRPKFLLAAARYLESCLCTGDPSVDNLPVAKASLSRCSVR